MRASCRGAVPVHHALDRWASRKRARPSRHTPAAATEVARSESPRLCRRVRLAAGHARSLVRAPRLTVATAATSSVTFVRRPIMTRALVLGSGGLTGIAWEAGVLQGLADGGTPIGDWDLVVGSSAGALVGARLLAEGSAEPTFRSQLAVGVRAEEQALASATGRLLIWLIRAARQPGLSWAARAGVLPLALRAVTANAARYGRGEFATLRVILRSRRPGASAAETLRALGRLARGSRAPEGVG